MDATLLGELKPSLDPNIPTWLGQVDKIWAGFGVSLVVFKHKLYRLIEWGGGVGGGYDVTL